MQSMFWMFLSQDVADKGGLGMADQLYKEFCRMAELDPKATDAPTVEHLQ
jgi:Rod binding domain-containing protein